MDNTSPGAVRAATGADGYFAEQQPPSDSAARPSAQPELLSSAEYAEVSNGTNAYSGLLTQEEAAEFLGCSKPHLASRCKDVPSVLIGRRRFYKPDDLLAWKAARASEIKIIQRLGGTYERHARNYKGDIRRLEQAIYEIAVKHWPMTVRQLFYQLVVLSLISKDLRGYNQVVALLRNMRDAAYDPSIKVSVEIPIHWIIDNSRRNTERQSFISPEGALEWITRIYRKDFWHNKSERVLVIVEKDALAGTLFDVTEQYDVPIIVPRGYSSISYVARLVEEIARWEDQDIFLYYFADLDPSGQDAARAFEDRLRMMLDPDSRDRILVHNAAITFDQVKKYNLWAAGRDTKTSDSRAEGFFAEYGNGALSYELDALPPNDLRQLVRDCICSHVPDYVHVQRLEEERLDREHIASLLAGDDTDYAWSLL